jgi:diguanylate cyclase (GGDEF)-like protein
MGVLCVVLAGLAMVLRLHPTVPLRVMALLPFTGVLVICAAIAISDPISGTPYFFLWPALNSAYFFGRRHLTAVLLTISVGYATVLALWVDAPLRTSDFSTVMVPVVVAAIAVFILRGQVRALIEQLHCKLAELQEAASHDPLTGVLNRRAFDPLLERETGRAREAGLALSLIVVDVDHFKRVNDRLGHAGGDEALRLVADVLVAERRSGDLVARLGGEEFGVVLLGADAEEAADVADRIGALLASRTAGHAAPLTLSAGVAALEGPIRTADQLLVAADRALYAAKASGRARTAVAGPAVHVRPPQDLTGRRLAPA